jgi:hypothetical protein
MTTIDPHPAPEAQANLKAGSEELASYGPRLSPGASGMISNLGPLGDLAGRWSGIGFNTIWRPQFTGDRATEHFLQLNLTTETLEVRTIGGPIPNRGLIEKDIILFGLRYLQEINDANFAPPDGGGGLHLEPGVWLHVPANSESPQDTAVRMGSIPHGTTIGAQGTAFTVDGGPVIAPVSITPFPIGNPNQPIPFPETDLATPDTNSPPTRTAPLPAGITQALVDDPNSFLRDQNAAVEAQGWAPVTTTVVDVSTANISGDPQGGSVDIPFLIPNADVATITSTFWVTTFARNGSDPFVRLQYTQNVLLDFNTLSWPHVTVGSLVLAN